MSSETSVQRSQPQPHQRLNRVLYCLAIVSFFLPFATVKSCTGDEGEGDSYTGIQLLGEDAGALLIGVILLAMLLLAFSFRHRVLSAIWQGILSAIKALLCALAILTTFFATGITFMFSRVSLQAGFHICVGSWFLLQILFTHGALRNHTVARSGCREPPPPWGLAVGVLVTTVVVASAWISEPNGIVELLLGVFAGFLIGAPLIIVAMLLAVLYRLRIQKLLLAGEQGRVTQ